MEVLLIWQKRLRPEEDHRRVLFEQLGAAYMIVSDIERLVDKIKSDGMNFVGYEVEEVITLDTAENHVGLNSYLHNDPGFEGALVAVQEVKKIVHVILKSVNCDRVEGLSLNFSDLCTR
ncbi:MAG: hypothetical protein Q8Q06_02575 [bacterium]|nr:hypothetical protein [bacterium]